MTTPDSSIRLRAAIDEVATARHETAFQLLDLHRAVSHRTATGAGDRIRADRLVAALDEIIVEIDLPPAGPSPITRTSDNRSSTEGNIREW